ncbi:hypothetical protein EGT71_17165 [Atlantibacter subterranea]|jgi:hypothetical protein|uniref:Uncharacterized protein n=1 Tax=Atlantibacter subterraneus TaxID=255519 RepID=A0A3R9EXA5_9ENTR|nr:hypothetical protein [Atlantibacter subterranea]MDA3131333.1 hypothetical protein [Atlantibacter subterranea]MDW2740966.1 hypothetical protein [Atlantibacter subterranea]RSB61056.1 hypothetical protein EGK67_15595 [Atlantibacter subterranea]RSE05502.1 hypothetical protein EGT84_12060 [Atlantibacter subterranea]RSE23871.1 hypothetical protein EGT71_17165 [Atlantibacter subterranea]
MVLEGYFDDTDAVQNKQRLLAVAAALEIAKSAVGAGNGISGARTEYDLQSVAREIGPLADAIQEALAPRS